MAIFPAPDSRKWESCERLILPTPWTHMPPRWPPMCPPSSSPSSSNEAVPFLPSWPIYSIKMLHFMSSSSGEPLRSEICIYQRHSLWPTMHFVFCALRSQLSEWILWMKTQYSPQPHLQLETFSIWWVILTGEHKILIRISVSLLIHIFTLKVRILWQCSLQRVSRSTIFWNTSFSYLKCWGRRAQGRYGRLRLR